MSAAIEPTAADPQCHPRLGAGYALLDTYYSLRGRVFLGRYPLAVSSMEALFIGLLCYLRRRPGEPVPLLLFSVADLLRHSPFRRG